MGTPRKYDKSRHPLVAEGMAIRGATVAEIAEGLAVSARTVSAWIKQHEEFAEAVSSGRDMADARVQYSLYRSACEGNVTACIFWLKNRRPAEWRDRQEVHGRVDVRPVDAEAVRAKITKLLGRLEATAPSGSLEVRRAHAALDRFPTPTTEDGP